MDSSLKLLQNQLDKKLPFVSYRKPNENIVNNILQNDDELNIVNDYKEQGFVFAPFDASKNTILIPLDNSFKFPFNETADFKDNNEIELLNAEKDFHVNLVDKAIKLINNTDLEKVVLSRLEIINAEDNPLTYFINTLKLYKNAFVYLWYHPKIGCWLGATPETLLETKNNRFKTMSLAGTKIYNEDVNWSDKEIEEQNIVTEFIKSSLSQCDISFKVTEPFTLKAGKLAHIRTDITGFFKLDKINNIENILKALHPTPAVCGYPKNDAKDFIISNEGYDREYYTGFLGELNMEGYRNKNKRNTENSAYRFNSVSSNLYVNLRCMKLLNKKAYIYVGGGVTAKSNSNVEFLETCNKSQTMKKVIQG